MEHQYGNSQDLSQTGNCVIFTSKLQVLIIRKLWGNFHHFASSFAVSEAWMISSLSEIFISTREA
ncbi:hypothetical protein EI555_014091 [Monodon monoceros]|uniref:Uncharacterized protein n=1 Tax=Monodon monoceros TaxID=40151 RepID=A0A4U1F5F8_MONMO|nr:hypothetical protein EI555_014091 [Monodon monoceros]